MSNKIFYTEQTPMNLNKNQRIVLCAIHKTTFQYNHIYIKTNLKFYSEVGCSFLPSSTITSLFKHCLKQKKNTIKKIHFFSDNIRASQT